MNRRISRHRLKVLSAIGSVLFLLLSACSTPPPGTTQGPGNDVQAAADELETFSRKELPKGAEVTKSGKVLNKKGEVIGVVKGSEAAEEAKKDDTLIAAGGSGKKAKKSSTNTAAAPAAAYKGEIGVSDDAIRIGFLYPRSGPYQALTRNFDEAIEGAFRAINEAGGVHGRDLVAVLGDDGYNNASIALSAAKAMQDQVYGVSTLGFNGFAAVAGFLNENRVPFLYGNGDRETGYNMRYAFPVATFLQTQAEMLPDFMIKRLDATSKKIGILYQDTPDLKPAVGSFQAAAEDAGLDVVITQQVAETPSQCVNEVSKLQQAGAEVVWLAVGPLPAACALRDASSLAYRPQWTGTGNTFNFNVTNQASGCRTEGIVSMSAWHTLESADGQRFSAAMRKYYSNNSDAPNDDFAYLGWGQAMMWAETLRLAGPQPTRESFVVGTETMRAWNGGMFSPRTFGKGLGPANRMGSRKVITVTVRDCEWVTVDDKWREY